MPHIHTEPGQHDATASAIIIRYENQIPHVLLHVHKKFSVLLQPGGHVELEETPWQAILHEIVEETGYDVSQLKLLQPKQRIRSLANDVLHPVPVVTNTYSVENTSYLHFHTDTIYAFITDELPTNAPGKDESQDLRWFTRNEMMASTDPMLLQGTKEICKFVFDSCVPNWEIVPISDFTS